METKSKPIESTIAGIVAKHAIITSTCIKNRTPSGAFEEAIDRLRKEYFFILEKRKDKFDFHLVLTVEQKVNHENLHPYYCGGHGDCVHCDRVKTEIHNPETCELCKKESEPNVSHANG